jgi:hypothetical protein
MKRKRLTRLRISAHTPEIERGWYKKPKREERLCKACLKIEDEPHFLLDCNIFKIELGRYKKIPRHQRLCRTCKVLDDEIHFFLQCQINNNLRNVLINNIKSIMLISTNCKIYINSWSRIFAQCCWLYKAIVRIAKMRFTLVNV